MRASFQKIVEGLRRIASKVAGRLFASAACPQNENAIFNEAVNNLPQGIVVFDNDRRVVFCNARYRDIYHLPPDRAKAGTPVSDLIRHRVLLGPGDRARDHQARRQSRNDDAGRRGGDDRAVRHSAP